jgi:glycyl-tRNA synthetase alpha chain
MKSFQEIIFLLQKFWSNQGCAILQPIDLEVGAGTLHPATVLKALGKEPWKVAYVQGCRRPTDARYGLNPNRLSYYYQFQTLLKPAPKNIRELYLESLEIIGLDVKNNDIRFVEDDWENPTVGASGLGFEVWFNGMEVSQFTYMQQVGGIECEVVAGEITYGLERLAMHIQGVNSILEINWNGKKEEDKITYADVFLKNEQQNSAFILENGNQEILFRHFEDAEKQSNLLSDKNLPLPAYEQALKASHLLNLIDAGGFISVTERASYISRVRNMVKRACQLALQVGSKI